MNSSPVDVVREPASKLFGRAIGERDGTDAVRIDTGGDQMLDSGDETERLAGTGTRNDKDGTHGRVDGPTLLRAHRKKTRDTSTNNGIRMPALYAR